MGNFWKSFIESYNSTAKKMNMSEEPVFRDYKDQRISSQKEFDVIKIDLKKKITCNINKKWFDITSVYLSGDYAIYDDNENYLLVINSRLGTGGEKKRLDCKIHVKRNLPGDDLIFSLANTIVVYHGMLKSGTLMADTLAKQEEKINSKFGLKTKYKVAVSIGTDGIFFRDSNKVLTIEEVCIRIAEDLSALKVGSGFNGDMKPIANNGTVKHIEKEKKQENIVNELEKRFAIAYEYLQKTSAKDIATRTAIYGAYVNFYLKENFAHDYYLDIVAALCGPFRFNCIIEDRVIKKMLEDTRYGFVDVSSGWITPLRNWILSNYGYKCDEYLRNIVAYLDQGKGEEILEHFNYITQVLQPNEYCYFPEMNPSMNRHINSSTWPRI